MTSRGLGETEIIGWGGPGAPRPVPVVVGKTWSVTSPGSGFPRDRSERTHGLRLVRLLFPRDRSGPSLRLSFPVSFGRTLLPRVPSLVVGNPTSVSGDGTGGVRRSGRRALDRRHPVPSTRDEGCSRLGSRTVTNKPLLPCPHSKTGLGPGKRSSVASRVLCVHLLGIVHSGDC